LIASSSADAVKTALGAIMARPDSTPLLGTLRCPVLIVVGEDDRLTPVDDSRAMQAQISGSELAVIPGAAHVSNLEQPAAFNARLASFLGNHF
jgi:3-oxoadipate enol-lactonase